ncbi:MAG TPA: RluA family pseudouridine synthase [Rectinemataceae bacterium]|nr:RluA family pseudouridine synthase [Rectinemataceae bacterium]
MRRLEYVEFRTGIDDVGRRLDRVVRRLLGEVPLGTIYGALRRGRILVNGRRAKPDYRICGGDVLGMDPGLIPGPEGAVHTAPAARPDFAELEGLLVASSPDLLFLNKPKGMLTHGPGSLGELVSGATGKRASESLSFASGPLHRLDRNSSGLIVFSASARGAREFSALLRSHSIRKRYIALMQGELAGEETWIDTIARDRELGISRTGGGTEGKAAETRAWSLAVHDNRTLAAVEIRSGRTHQIRVQAAAHGHPLVGDTKYGGEREPEGYLLHAYVLAFPLRPLEGMPESVVAPVSAADRKRLERLFPGYALDDLLAGMAVVD